MYIRPTKCVYRPTQCVYWLTKVGHPTYKSWASDLQKLCIRHTKVVHPTYKSFVSDLIMLCIRPTRLFIWPTNAGASNLSYIYRVSPTDSYSCRYTNFVPIDFVSDIHGSIGPTAAIEAAENHVRVCPKYRRADVIHSTFCLYNWFFPLVRSEYTLAKAAFFTFIGEQGGLFKYTL